MYLQIKAKQLHRMVPRCSKSIGHRKNSILVALFGTQRKELSPAANAATTQSRILRRFYQHASLEAGMERTQRTHRMTQVDVYLTSASSCWSLISALVCIGCSGSARVHASRQRIRVSQLSAGLRLSWFVVVLMTVCMDDFSYSLRRLNISHSCFVLVPPTVV